MRAEQIVDPAEKKYDTKHAGGILELRGEGKREGIAGSHFFSLHNMGIWPRMNWTGNNIGIGKN